MANKKIWLVLWVLVLALVIVSCDTGGTPTYNNTDSPALHGGTLVFQNSYSSAQYTFYLSVWIEGDLVVDHYRIGPSESKRMTFDEDVSWSCLWFKKVTNGYEVIEESSANGELTNGRTKTVDVL